MRFDKLNEMIPYVVGGKPKVLTMHPYNAITLAMPGRHAKDTDPVGGDFVVMVDDETLDWTRHQFTHTDIFQDLQKKFEYSPVFSQALIEHYRRIVVEGFDPDKIEIVDYEGPGIHPTTFIHAIQCLAVAEHRRYARFEPQFGGRFLPLRFGAGIVEGYWTASDASEKQRRGRPGVEWLEKDFGTPLLTKAMMS